MGEASEAKRRDRAIAGLVKLAQSYGAELEPRDVEAAAWDQPGAPTPDSIGAIAGQFGFDVEVKPLKARRPRAVKPPYLAIAVESGESYLVMGLRGGAFAVIDPETGADTGLGLAELNEQAAVAVSLRPKRGARAQKSLWRDNIRPRLTPIGWEIGVASAAVNLLALATPLFVMTVFNRVVAQGGLETLDVLAIGMMVVFAFDFVLRTIRSHVAAHVGARLEAAIGGEVGRKILRLPYRAFEDLEFGKTQERIRQLDRVRAFFTGSAPLTLADILFSGLFLLALFVIEPVIGWITAAAIPFFLLFSYLSQGRQRDLAQEDFRAQSAKTGLIAEAMTNALTVKALSLERSIERRLDKKLAASALASFESARLRSLVSNAGLVLQHAVTLAVIYVGARLILSGESSIGALIAGAILASRALAPMRMAVGAWRQLAGAREALARLDALVNQKPERRGDLPEDSPALEGGIKLDNVTFRYGEEAPAILERASLVMRRGEITGLVGLAGAGKSTVLKLLLGLEHPQQGKVLYNDVDLAKLPATGVRSRVGVVPQDCQLFQASILDNIAVGADDADRAQAIAAARFVGLDAVVEALPNGYDSKIGERGVKFSAGQRQMVALARAVVRNPTILFFDEATSALDAKTERRFLANLRGAAKGRTMLMITHRASALAICDSVMVLEDGRFRQAKTPRLGEQTRPQAEDRAEDDQADDAGKAQPFLRAVG